MQPKFRTGTLLLATWMLVGILIQVFHWHANPSQASLESHCVECKLTSVSSPDLPKIQSNPLPVSQHFTFLSQGTELCFSASDNTQALIRAPPCLV